MTLDEVATLAREMRTRGLSEFEIERPGARLRLVGVQAVARPAETTAEAVRPAQEPLCAPDFGIFRQAHPLRGTGPGEGKPVAAGEAVGFVEADEVLVPVLAERAGRIGRFLVEDGTLVGYRQPLVAMD